MAASGASSSCARPRPTEDRSNGLEAASKKTPYRAGTTASACTRATPARGEGDGRRCLCLCVVRKSKSDDAVNVLIAEQQTRVEQELDPLFAKLDGIPSGLMETT